MSKKSRKSKYCVSTQVFVSLLALVLVMGVAVGGTIAWLTDSTQEVKNTFTVGDINIELTETKDSAGNEKDTNTPWSAKLIPGAEYTKNPKVTVNANSEKCYLFVEVKGNNNPSSYLDYTYTMEPTEENGWHKGLVENDSTVIPETVYWRVVDASANDQSWELLVNNKVTVKNTLTKNNMPKEDVTPELIYVAYACQEHGLSAAQAWAQVNPGTAN